MRPGRLPEQLEKVVAARLARQGILERDDPPWIVLVLAEYAVRRVIGSREIMAAQLAHLLRLAERPNVTIQIVPEAAPVYFGTAYTLMSFSEGQDALYLETPEFRNGLTYDPEYVCDRKRQFDLARSAALSAADSEKLIRTILEGL